MTQLRHRLHVGGQEVACNVDIVFAIPVVTDNCDGTQHNKSGSVVVSNTHYQLYQTWTATSACEQEVIHKPSPTSMWWT
jgi:hypothetical protein